MKKLKLEELGRITVDEFKESVKLPITIVLDNVRSLHNVGSAFRTADAFKVEKIYLTGITGTPPHREIEKTALGATQSVDWEYAESTAFVLEHLRKNNYKIVIIEQTTHSISLNNLNANIDEKYCLVFGNEVHGVSDEAVSLGDMALEIPQYGTKHSLNISVCLGIVTWEFFKKLRDLR
ncbi:RNA methyltransferase [Chryseosolibacter indicus]|uniref:RNA methyltransferase n=1 Tax=Chryseosolibacter indicus TaxID=2782351 RepID=A0ABS5VNQ4_9BACT|nr:RNA methyltransferase [Chryseosolibacter indicus]MBT1703074.1 RNA methyltransferase [Chryseosolibacter indicus]